VFAGRRQPRLDAIGLLALGAVPHLDDHCFPHARCSFALTTRGAQIHRFETSSNLSGLASHAHRK
jgi:hypothetical protein